MKKIALALCAALALSACSVTPETEATPVNMVEFRDGKVVRVDVLGPNTVVCQDYWQHFTLWDRSVTRPDWMSEKDANAVCRSSQQMVTEAPTAKPWEPVFNHKKNTKDALIRDDANGSAGRIDVRAY